jgi:hypothetical protein
VILMFVKLVDVGNTRSKLSDVCDKLVSFVLFARYVVLVIHVMILLCICEVNDIVGVSDPGGPSTEPTSEFIVACPCPDGLAQDGTQGETRLVLSRTGGARSRGYKRRERERE